MVDVSLPCTHTHTQVEEVLEILIKLPRHVYLVKTSCLQVSEINMHFLNIKKKSDFKKTGVSQKTPKGRNVTGPQEGQDLGIIKLSETNPRSNLQLCFPGHMVENRTSHS